MESKKNYGNNISISFCRKKYVIGNNMNISLVITMTFTYTLIIFFWIILLYQLYPLYLFFIGFILYLFLLYYYLKSFFTEPGIIPRNHPKYILNNSVNPDNLKDIDFITAKSLENSTKEYFSIDSHPPIISNINILDDNYKSEDIDIGLEKKKNKIFPDFILAESAEEIKNNKQMNNSITGWTNGSFFNQNIFDQNETIYSKEKNVYIYNNKINKHISKDILKNDKTLDIIENNYMPHIFQNRPCKTCNIIRPPKTSHCVICDNCIMELDHHCFYISNCVGARNRKYFILFLIFGFHLTILCILTSLYHLIYAFIILKEKKYLTILLFKNYYIQIGISILVMLIGIIILLIKKESLKLSCAIFIPGNILFDFYFYYNKYKNEIEPKKIIDFTYHPFSLCLIYSILPLLLFVSKYLKKQIKLVGKGLTTKQFVSIKEERNKNIKNKAIYDYLDLILKRKVNYSNIINFFFRKNQKSLINVENIKKKKEEK